MHITYHHIKKKKIKILSNFWNTVTFRAQGENIFSLQQHNEAMFGLLHLFIHEWSLPADKLSSPLGDIADINFKSDDSLQGESIVVASQPAALCSPQPLFSSLFWFTGLSGWDPTALTSPCIQSHGLLPAHKLKQTVQHLCIEKKTQIAEVN